MLVLEATEQLIQLLNVEQNSGERLSMKQKFAIAPRFLSNKHK